MAFTIPEIEPTKAYAGDRLQWRRTDLSDFPATTWSLAYYLRSSAGGGNIDIAATTDGTSFSIDVSPTESGSFIPATYYWTAFVSKSGDRKLIGQGRIEILTNPVDVTGPSDGRTHARKTLDAIEAVIEKRATSDQQRYVFQAVGRSVDKMPIADVLKFRDYYAGIVLAEEQQERVARGESSGRNIYVRFGP
jgi:hypothetical protein